MQQGAEQAARALDTVGQKAEKTGRQINVSTEAIERKLDAIVDGIAAQNRMMEESGRKTEAQLKQTDRALDQTRTQVGKLGGEVSKATGIMAAMEEKFRALGKAAVGMFAADVLAKVAGFNSAMDVLQKASNAAAEGIRAIGIEILGLGEVVAQGQVLESLNEQLEKLQQQRAGGFFQMRVGGQTVELQKPKVDDIEQQILMLQMVIRAQNRIADIEAGLTQGGGIIGGGGALTRQGAGNLSRQVLLDELNGVQTVQTVLADLRAELDRFAKAGEKAVAATGSARKLFEIQDTMPDPSKYRAGRIEFGGGAPSDRRGTIAEQAQTEFLRRIAINTQSTRQQFGYGYGIPEETFQPQLVPAMGGILGDQTPTVPFYERGRGAQAVTPNQYEQRYSVENIAQDTAAQFYNSLKGSLMTGDFSDFGRQVTAMIGSSLIDALIAAPFQEAMSALVQALLAGIRGGLGMSTGAPAAAAPAPSQQYRAATASTSNAPYRSQRQQFDDASRRRIV